MLKNWFLLASVSCGVGFGSTFLISRNLQQSTWAGLGTVPAVAASIKILSRQRKEEIERQITKSRLSLDNTQQQERLAKEEIERQVTKSRLSLEEIERQVAKSRSSLDDARQQEQLVKNSCREISAHGQKLQTGFIQLRQEVDRDRERQAELEREINSLVLHKQTQKSLLGQLEAKVLDRQNQLETTNTELARIQAQRQLQIDSGRQLNLQLQSIREEVRQDSAVKEQLEAQLTELQNRLQSLQTILVDKEVDLRGIEYQISQMEERRDRDSTAVAELDRALEQKQSLLQDIALDRHHQQLLKKEISDLLLQKQKQEILLDELKSNINSTQNLQSELEAQVSSTQDHLDRIAIDLSELKSKRATAIDSARTSELTLANICEQINQHSANKETLEAELADLQNRGENIQAEIALREVERTEVQQQISALKEQQEIISIAVDDLNRSIGEKQSFFDDLELEICNRQQVKEDINSQITELENSISLFSAHTTGEVLNIGIADLYRRWQEVSQQVSQREDGGNPSSIIVIDPVIEPDPSIVLEEWERYLINDPYLPVFQYIYRWGAITESQVNHTLGNSRIGRQFTREFKEYYQYLPFSIRVETSTSGSRYVKEIITTADSQNSGDILPVSTVDCTQIDRQIVELKEQKEQLSIAVAELSRSLDRDLEQQAVLQREIADLLLKKQELEYKVRSEQDRLTQLKNDIEKSALDSDREAKESPSNLDACEAPYFDRRCSCGGTPMCGELFCYRCSC